MKSTILGIVALGTCAIASLHAEEDAKAAKNTLNHAIQAMGGADKLKAKGMSGKSKGFVLLQGNRSVLTNEWIVQGIDQFQWTTEVQLGDNPATIVLTLNRDKAWIKGNQAEANELDKPVFRAIREGFIGLRLVESLLPLKQKEWKLSSLGEIQIDKRPAIGIKAVKKGFPDLDVYFDKSTRLPVKAEMRIVESDGTDVGYVARFLKYVEVDGRKVISKLQLLRDDKLILEMERHQMRVLESVDNLTFTKP